MSGLAAAGAVISLISSGVGLFSSWKNSLTQQQISELQRLQQEQGTVEGLQANFINNYGTLSDAIYQKNSLGLEVRNSRLALRQAGANIDAYDQSLARFDSQYASGLMQLQAEGRNQFYQLMENYSGVGVANAAKGQRGGSASLIAQMAKSQVIQLAGSDMKLDANGGTYGYSLTDFFLDQLASQRELQQNRTIQEESWDIYHDTLMKDMENYDQASKLEETAKANMRTAFDNLYSYYGKDIQGNIDSYNKDLESYNNAMEAWLGGDRSYEIASTIYSSYTGMQKSYDAYAELLQKQKDAISPFNEELISQFLTDADKGNYSFDFSNALESSWTGLSAGYGNISSSIADILFQDDGSDDDTVWDDDGSSPLDTLNRMMEDNSYRGTFGEDDALIKTGSNKKSQSTSKAPYKSSTSYKDSRFPALRR